MSLFKNLKTLKDIDTQCQKMCLKRGAFKSREGILDTIWLLQDRWQLSNIFEAGI